MMQILVLVAVLRIRIRIRIRIHRIHMFLGLPDLSSCKNSKKKTLIPTILWLILTFDLKMMYL